MDFELVRSGGMNSLNFDCAKLSKRQENIIACLLEGSFFTSAQLALTLGVSQRTVKEDIKMIKSLEKKIGIQVLAQNRKGYSVLIINNYLFNHYNNKGMSIDLNIQNDRILVLIQYLLTRKSFVIVDDLAELLNVSVSTLNNDLKIVKNILLKENLEILSKPNCGIKIKGTERTLRATLSKYINLDLFSIESYNNLFKDSTITYSDMKILADYFVKIFKDYYYDLIGIGITNLLIHIIIIINRTKSGFKIEHFESEHLTQRREYQLALNIADFLEEKFSISLPEEEIQYLSFCLLNNGTIRYKSTLVESFLTVLYSDLQKSFDISLDVPHDEYNALYIHTLGILERLKFKLNVDGTGIVEMMRKRFVLAYEMAMLYKKDFENMLHGKLNDIEVCYVAVHFGAMIESAKIRKSLPKLIIITETRTGRALLLKNEILSHFSMWVNIVGIYSPYEMDQVDFDQVEFILSTENLGEDFTKPYLKISFDLNAASLRKIKAYLCNKTIIDNIFRENLFVKNTGDEKAGTFLLQCAKKFKSLELIKDEQQFYKLTCRREKMQSTRFDYIVAMPHPLQAISQKNFISISIFEKGIQWFDGGIVKLVLYIGFTGKNKEEITSIFDILSCISSNHILVDSLIKANSFADFISVLKLFLDDSKHTI